MNKLWQTLQNGRNQVDFQLREWVRWRRGGLRFDNQPKDNLFDDLSGAEKQQAEATAARLIEQYHLTDFYQTSTRINFRENLFYLSMLETAFDQAAIDLPDPLTTADIGPAHWFYVQALYAGLSWYGTQQQRALQLTGFEADAYRVFSSLYSRYDYALAHIRDLPVKLQAQAFDPHPQRYDLICMFFPFVFLKDHRAWGLPAAQFDPSRLRRAAMQSLTHEGLLLVVNQGLAEHQAEKKYLTDLGMRLVAAFEQDESLYRYDLKRFVLVAKYA